MLRHALIPVLAISAAAAAGGCAADVKDDPSAPAEAVAASEEALGYGITVNCQAVNHFGYVGSATGTLSITSHDWPSGFLLSGTLTVNTKMYGQPDHKQTLAIWGDIDASGQYAYVNPSSTTSGISQLNLVFAPNSQSNINANNTIYYQTDCSHSVVTLPKGSDLGLDHTMRVYPRGDGTMGVQVDVTNIGNVAATAANGRMRIGTHVVATSLHQYYGGTATAPNTVNPGETGYLLGVLPGGAVARCNQYSVQIDIDHDMQSGAPTPFNNDSGNVTTPCLTWTTPITEFAVGYSPEPITQYKTLGDIVSSKVVARESDGHTCNYCHVTGSSHPYSPPAGDIRPGQMIDGQTWAAGWAQTFVAQPDSVKPQYLKQLFKQWVQDGAQ